MGKSLSKIVWFDPCVKNEENTRFYEKLSDLTDVERFEKREEGVKYIRELK